MSTPYIFNFSREDLLLAYRRRLDGCPMQEIAEMYGCSRQTLTRAMHCVIDTGGKLHSIYPELDRYLNMHHMTIADLCRKTGINRQTMQLAIWDKDKMSKRTRSRIMEATGLLEEDL